MTLNFAVHIRFLQVPAILLIAVIATLVTLPSSAQVHHEDVASSPYESQWAGGCGQDCGKRIDAFCSSLPIPMCYDCGMYCQQGQAYFSLDDCENKCPAYAATVLATKPTVVTGDIPNVTSPPNVSPGNSSKPTPLNTFSTHRNNETTQHNTNATSTPPVGKISLKGSGVVFATTGFVVVLLVGMYFYWKSFRKIPRAASSNKANKVPEQTAGYQCKRNLLLRIGSCFRGPKNQAKEYRGIPVVVNAESSV